MDLTKCLIEGPVPTDFSSWFVADDPIHNSAGAMAIFLGRVRSDQVGEKIVSGIEYSAYEAMVEPVADAIKEQLIAEYTDLKSVHIFHSTGLVKCGEASLLVVVRAGHRKQSFWALEKCVELIKEKLPVWKKEWFTDGTSRWIE
jgi:molybdopterin synthase catalytic subunit